MRKRAIAFQHENRRLLKIGAFTNSKTKYNNAFRFIKFRFAKYVLEVN